MIIEAFHGVGIHEFFGLPLPHIAIEVSLGVILSSLIVTGVASLTATRKDGTEIV
jgi:tellurite resistance protein TerC